MAHDERFSVPPDLTLIGNESDLRDLEEAAKAEFARIDALERTPDNVAYALEIRSALSRVRTELRVRAQRVEMQAQEEARATEDQMTALRAEINGEEADASTTHPASDVSIAQAVAQGVTAALAPVLGEKRSGLATLGDTARVAPVPRVATERLAVTAAVDIPGMSSGGTVASLESLAEAFSRKAKAIPDSRSGNTESGHVVATVKNSFEHTLDDRTSEAAVGNLLSHLTRRDAKEALVAGGGWCAPSETRYEFFNIACSDGLIDLPTFGVTRGGIRFPVSPSLADAIGSNAFGGFAVPFTNASVPWLWTEADDIATVTGSPNKPCVRVPCPDFDEERLDCYGICLTAGNLTDDAYPEATQNTIRLLMAAHERAVNARLIALMVANSSAPISTGEYAGGGTPATAKPAFQQILSGIDLGAVDYRARYGMCQDDILEVVAPYWLRNVIRADLAWRTGVDLLSVADSVINSYFADRNLAVQWVNDWQVRGAGQFGNATPMTAWPTTVDVMIFAAGTFVHGQGMSLDLGVIRDSVLNAENDFTAAWSEECHLIARFGHESRQYRITFSVMGATSVANLVPGTSIDTFPNL